jgi:hypothetical protein
MCSGCTDQNRIHGTPDADFQGFLENEDLQNPGFPAL